MMSCARTPLRITEYLISSLSLTLNYRILNYLTLTLNIQLPHFARAMLTMATRSMFFYFSEKRHKIVEIFALLTTELSPSQRREAPLGEGY